VRYRGHLIHGLMMPVPCWNDVVIHRALACRPNPQEGRSTHDKCGKMLFLWICREPRAYCAVSSSGSGAEQGFVVEAPDEIEFDLRGPGLASGSRC
jgi:hypothetical protein